MGATSIEKQSLEAHVELCAERYKTLEHKFDSLEKRMDKIEILVVEIKDKLSTSNVDNNKQLIVIGTAIISALLTGLITVIVKLVTN